MVLCYSENNQICFLNMETANRDPYERQSTKNYLF